MIACRYVSSISMFVRTLPIHLLCTLRVHAATVAVSFPTTPGAAQALLSRNSHSPVVASEVAIPLRSGSR